MSRMRVHWAALVAIVWGGYLVAAAVAAPSLDITKPPVQPVVGSWTGPVFDPDAVRGQWFSRGAVGTTPEVRTHEFYDNVPGFGGGWAGAGAIRGSVVNVQVNPASGGITAFDIRATITNDTPGQYPWEYGVNSHNEMRPPYPEQYVGTLFDTKLTGSFAIDWPALMRWQQAGGGFVNPYVHQPLFLQATNFDQLAWYCYTPNNPVNLPVGDFLVPTWDFGDIPVGSSATRLLKLAVLTPGGMPGEIPPGSALYWTLMDGMSQDVLLNRTTSLKISNWIDTLQIDIGAPYPQPPMLSSDCSVFHNIPEPGSMALLLAGAVLLAWHLVRRR